MKVFFPIVSVWVLMVNFFAIAVVTAKVNEDGTENIIKKAAVILKASAEAINSGINPAFKGYKIRGMVMLGTNKCQSRGVTVQVLVDEEQRGEQNVTHITAYKFIKEDSRPIFCTMEYAPVYQPFVKEIRGQEVIVHNVGEMGKDVNADSLLDNRWPADPEIQ